MLQGEEPEKSTDMVPGEQSTFFSEVSASERPRGGNTTIAIWEKEQDYLKVLSDQYCLEKYQDSYDLMCEYFQTLQMKGTKEM